MICIGVVTGDMEVMVLKSVISDDLTGDMEGFKDIR